MKLRFLKQFLLCCAIMLVGSSCVKRARFDDRDRLKIKIQLARLADVPIPLGNKPVLEYIDDNSFAYLQDESLDLTAYYRAEMDQYGWNLFGAFEGLEQVLVFEKPHKLVSIVIRKQQDQNFVMILTLDK